MARRFGLLAAVLLLAPAPALAEDRPLAPEQFFSANSLLYVRFDGLDAHRAAYGRTAMGEVMAGDLGVFVDYVLGSSKNAIGPALLKDRILSGGDAKRLQAVRKGFKQTPEVLSLINRKGFAVGAEIISLYPYRAQLAIVFPGGGQGKDRAALDANLRMIAALAEVPISERKVDGRTFAQWDLKTKAIKIGWWTEGPHLIFVVSSEEPTYTLELVNGKRPDVRQSAHFRDLQKFTRYETAARGFIDLERPLKLARFASQFAGVDKYFDMLGVSNLKSLSVHFGFEGRHTRSTFVLKAPGPRKGLFNLSTATSPFDVAQLPPLPPDMSSLAAVHLDPGAVYDLALQTVVRAAESGDKDAKKKIQESLRQLDERLGVPLRQDLLGALGSKVVVYNSPSEGPLSLGFGVAVQVKDPAKLQAALDNLFQSLPVVLGEDISLKKQSYCGVDLYTVKLAQQGFFFVPAYAIYQDWFVVGMFPQTVQGYLVRATKRYSAWQPTPLVAEALAAVRKESPQSKVFGVTVNDPRPTLKHLCSIGPFIGGLVDSFEPGSFDVKKIPNAQAITEPLYPNVSVLIDDGDAIRMESYSSFTLPLFDITGVDGYFTGFIAFQIFRLMG